MHQKIIYYFYWRYVQVGLEVTHSLWAGGATDGANIGVCDFIYEEKAWSLEIGFCKWGFSRRKCT